MILRKKNKPGGITLSDLKLNYKAIVIKQKGQHIAMKQNIAQKKATYVQSTGLWQGGQGHTMGKGQSLQKMV